jgi:hypothetical protein
MSISVLPTQRKRKLTAYEIQQTRVSDESEANLMPFVDSQDKLIAIGMIREWRTASCFSQRTQTQRSVQILNRNLCCVQYGLSSQETKLSLDNGYLYCFICFQN